MREKEFTADVGDTGVNLLVQQVVTGVLDSRISTLRSVRAQSRTGSTGAIRSSVP